MINYLNNYDRYESDFNRDTGLDPKKDIREYLLYINFRTNDTIMQNESTNLKAVKDSITHAAIGINNNLQVLSKKVTTNHKSVITKWDDFIDKTKDFE